MDETTLNDLLECSVCLDRLDTSSKVLPCQHTFCGKCLQNIVDSHKALRCPECRVLVEVPIDELPPNVLLMRILSGMQQNSATSNNASATPPPPKPELIDLVSEPTPAQLADRTTTAPMALQPKPQPPVLAGQTNAAAIPTSSNRPLARALFDYTSKDQGDLSFRQGDLVHLRNRLDAHWFLAELNGRTGVVPVNHLQVLVAPPAAQCRALYDFRMGPGEADGCLTFARGAVIVVLRRVDQNWAEGRIGDAIGIFPLAFVEMNDLARRLLEPSLAAGGASTAVAFAAAANDAAQHHQQQHALSGHRRAASSDQLQSDSSSSSSSATLTNSIGSPTSTSSSSSSSSSDGGPPLMVVMRSHANRPSAETAANQPANKRHSVTAIMAGAAASNVVPNASANKRNSAEILDRNPTTTTTTNERPPEQAGRCRPAKHSSSSSSSSSAAAVPQPRPAQLHQPKLPASYIALYPYRPRYRDELELKKGQLYTVTERLADGWFRGRPIAAHRSSSEGQHHQASGASSSSSSSRTRIFPANYVAPLRSSTQRDRNQALNLQQQAHMLSAESAAAAAAAAGANAAAPQPPQRTNRSPVADEQHNTSRLFRSSVDGVGPSPTQQRSKQVNFAAAPQPPSEPPSSTSATMSLLKRLTRCTKSPAATGALSVAASGQQPTRPTSASYSMDNPVFEHGSETPAAEAPKSQRPATVAHLSHPVHVRSGSCPSQLLHNLTKDAANVGYGSQRLRGHKERPHLPNVGSRPENGATALRPNRHSMGGALCANSHPQYEQLLSSPPVRSSAAASHHRKSHSLDATSLPPPANQAAGGHAHHPSKAPAAMPVANERFKCVVAYPPNSKFELELKPGDIVLVYNKRDNGWYKGTHADTGRVGLFPASFVEPA